MGQIFEFIANSGDGAFVVDARQSIVLRNERVVWSGSHWEISDEALERALADARAGGAGGDG